MRSVFLKLFLICFLHFCLPFSVAAGPLNIDSLKMLLREGREDTVQLNVLLAIVENSNDETEWPAYNEKALFIARKLMASDDPAIHLKGLRGMGDALNNKGYLADRSGEKDKAIRFYESSILYRQKSHDERGLAEAYNNLASIYGQQGDVLRSLDLNQHSLDLREKIADKFGIAQSFNNIGYIYREQGDTAKALEFFQKSLAIKISIGDKKGIANSYNNIGLIFMQKGKMDSALSYFNRSLAIRKQIGHKWGIANSLNNIALIHIKRKEWHEALQLNEEALAIREEINDKEGMCFSLRYLGEIYFQIKQYDKAKEFAQRSLDAANNSGYVENIRFASQLLYELYKQKNDYRNALAMYELFKRMQDSMNNEETRRGAIRNQFRYEYEKKEDALKAHELEKEVLAQKEAGRQKLVLGIFITAFALMLVLSALMYNGYKNKKKANRIIAMQKELVEEKQKQMVDSIHYAKRIQEAMLPSVKYFEKNLERLRQNKK